MAPLFITVEVEGLLEMALGGLEDWVEAAVVLEEVGSVAGPVAGNITYLASTLYTII